MSYTPTEWASGDVVTAAKLNHIEGGIVDLNTDVAALDAGDIAYDSSESYSSDTVGSELANVKNHISNLEAVESTVIPANKYNPNAITTGAYLNASGAVVDSTTSFITDFIPVKNGDTVYLTVINAGASYINPSSCNMMRIVRYDSSKSALGYSDYANSVAITADGYIRAALANSYLNFKLVSITVNAYPANADAMQAFFAPHYAAVSSNMSANTETIIDCWGDSRVENGSSGTPFPTYLKTLLGYGYAVNNYGVSSQTSGEVAMRFGTNEVYLRLDGDEIPATTDAVAVTGIICSTGDRFGFANLYNLSGTKPVECYLCGVKGYLSITSVSVQKFTRAEAGDAAVAVPPFSRAWVTENDSDLHTVIIWVGKNDQTSAGDPWYRPGVLSNIKGMVNRLKHNRFIILGDTNDTSNAQKKGTNWYTRITTLNAELAVRYPDNFIDIRTKLITDGLADAGITPTEDDTAWIADGCIPPSLMADASHPNDAGKELVAQYVYAFMQSKGWA